ncbi:hypothetical protein [Streptomyces roseoverticillatus]|uniref:hypothetical protein n=1 Tax=Streptomyces roseoverticillatus TaxID=66429 RepID=UPI0027E50C76|nr:hypothetical protein [Streptomyces roseoverticillatus]
MPDRLVVYAVEGADGALGRGLSPAVAAAVEPLAQRVEEEIAQQLAVSRAVRAGAPSAGPRDAGGEEAHVS